LVSSKRSGSRLGRLMVVRVGLIGAYRNSANPINVCGLRLQIAWSSSALLVLVNRWLLLVLARARVRGCTRLSRFVPRRLRSELSVFLLRHTIIFLLDGSISAHVLLPAPLGQFSNIWLGELIFTSVAWSFPCQLLFAFRTLAALAPTAAIMGRLAGIIAASFTLHVFATPLTSEVS